jgi:hypothetical protein
VGHDFPPNRQASGKQGENVRSVADVANREFGFGFPSSMVQERPFPKIKVCFWVTAPISRPSDAILPGIELVGQGTSGYGRE